MPIIEAQICEEHARQAAFLWLFRSSAVRDHAYDLADLCAEFPAAMAEAGALE